MSARLPPWLRRLHTDEDGKLTVEWILLIVFITLPLLAVLIAFKNKIIEMLKHAWDAVFGQSQQTPPP